MYRCIGLEESSASRNKSCATVRAESVSRIGPYNIITRSRNRREKMSYDRSPLPVCSMTMGTRFADGGPHVLEILCDVRKEGSRPALA